MEAASQELCCIASDVAALSEFIIHQKTGWLVPPNNPSALAQAIIDLSSDHKLRKDLGINNYKRLKADFCHRSGIDIILKNLQVQQGTVIDNTTEHVT
jgi:glycosyltransferase involved in cell wall biosynthesis